MPVCAIYGCNNSNKNTKGTSIKYYSFPKDEEFCKKWIKACKRQDEINIINACVCSIHFSKECFCIPLRQRLLNYTTKSTRNLAPDAVPTLFIPTIKSVISSHKHNRRKSINKKKFISERTEINVEGNTETLLNISEGKNDEHSDIGKSLPKQEARKRKVAKKPVTKTPTNYLNVNTLPAENEIEKICGNEDATENCSPKCRSGVKTTEIKSISEVHRNSLQDKDHTEDNDILNDKNVNDNSIKENSRKRKAETGPKSRRRKLFLKDDVQLQGNEILADKEKDNEIVKNNKILQKKTKPRKRKIFFDDAEIAENEVPVVKEEGYDGNNIQVECSALVVETETVGECISNEHEEEEEENSLNKVHDGTARLRAENEYLKKIIKKYESDRISMYSKLKALKNNPANLDSVLSEMLLSFSPAERVIALLSKLKRT